MRRLRDKMHYGTATCVCHLADIVLNQRPAIVSGSSQLLDEHRVREVSLSVPPVAGPSGVQQRIRERWEPEEYQGFLDAVEKAREILKYLK